MANKVLRAEAIQLRLSGYTYNQIKKELGLAKSTLSDWLKNLPLSEEQLNLLIKNKELSKDIRIERFRQTALNKRTIRLTKVLAEQERELLPLSEKELFIAGVFLYWGEGSKQRGKVSVSNTNLQVMKFALYWMTKILKVPKKKISVLLHLYTDMSVEKETAFWSDSLKIPVTQFRPPYIKRTTMQSLSYKSFGHGTCNLMCFDTTLCEKIAMSIKAIAGYYGANSDLFWYN